MNKQLQMLLICWSVSSSAMATTVSLQQAIEAALNSDPRISEKRAFVEHAQALLQEAQGSRDISLSANAFVGFSPGLDGGLFKSSCGNSNDCVLRDDRYKLSDGLSPWFNGEFGLVKPLYTFGKIENYSEAAEANIKVKEQEVRLQKGQTILDVTQAYYGYLTAKNTHLFIEDVKTRIETALENVRTQLEDNEGEVTQGDMFALEAAKALAESYIARVNALEQVAIEGLKVLMGVSLAEPLGLADENLIPLPLPNESVAEFQQSAMQNRAEVIQLQHGLKARQALVKAKQSMKKPNVYAALVGMLSYSPLRDRVDNPHIYDPFNDVGMTPIVGVQWSWAGSVQSAQANQAKAELAALVEKDSLAQRGIPYQVSERFAQVHAHHQAVQELEKSAKSARKWLISNYTDFEAGLIGVDKLVTAFQAYVTTYVDYLKTVFEYNMQVTHLMNVSGKY